MCPDGLSARGFDADPPLLHAITADLDPGLAFVFEGALIAGGDGCPNRLLPLGLGPLRFGIAGLLASVGAVADVGVGLTMLTCGTGTTAGKFGMLPRLPSIRPAALPRLPSANPAMLPLLCSINAFCFCFTVSIERTCSNA